MMDIVSEKLGHGVGWPNQGVFIDMYDGAVVDNGFKLTPEAAAGLAVPWTVKPFESEFALKTLGEVARPGEQWPVRKLASEGCCLWDACSAAVERISGRRCVAPLLAGPASAEQFNGLSTTHRIEPIEEADPGSAAFGMADFGPGSVVLLLQKIGFAKHHWCALVESRDPAKGELELFDNLCDDTRYIDRADLLDSCGHVSFFCLREGQAGGGDGVVEDPRMRVVGSGKKGAAGQEVDGAPQTCDAGVQTDPEVEEHITSKVACVVFSLIIGAGFALT